MRLDLYSLGANQGDGRRQSDKGAFKRPEAQLHCEDDWY